jgi:hypothetical protein
LISLCNLHKAPKFPQANPLRAPGDFGDFSNGCCCDAVEKYF